jgi:hypothetical protein
MKRTFYAWLPVLGLAIILALSLAVTATQANAQSQGSGTINGQVVNGTAGGPAIGAGITVTLYLVQSDAVTGTLETTTDSAGRFRFENLSTDLDWSYWPQAVYLGVTYTFTGFVTFEDGQTAQVVTLPVYETTDDDSQISIYSGHIIAESFGTVLRISEVYLFSNSGDRAYVGRPGPEGRLTTVGIPLPSDAVGLAFGQDVSPDRFVQSEGKLLNTEPVPPGQQTLTVFYSYHLPVAGTSVPWERSYDYPITSLNLLLAQPGLAAQGDQLLAGGSELFGDQQLAVYTAGALPAGTPLAVTLIVEASEATGTTTTAESGKPITDNQGLLRGLGFGLAGLAVLGAVLYPLLTAQSRRPIMAASALASNPQARPLLADLADLEAAFEAGQVDEETYQRQRAEKWEALRSL